MKDRSLALLFRSETEQERAQWVDSGQLTISQNSPIFGRNPRVHNS